MSDHECQLPLWGHVLTRVRVSLSFSYWIREGFPNRILQSYPSPPWFRYIKRALPPCIYNTYGRPADVPPPPPFTSNLTSLVLPLVRLPFLDKGCLLTHMRCAIDTPTHDPRPRHVCTTISHRDRSTNPGSRQCTFPRPQVPPILFTRVQGLVSPCPENALPFTLHLHASWIYRPHCRIPT